MTDMIKAEKANIDSNIFEPIFLNIIVIPMFIALIIAEGSIHNKKYAVIDRIFLSTSIDNVTRLQLINIVINVAARNLTLIDFGDFIAIKILHKKGVMES